MYGVNINQLMGCRKMHLMLNFRLHSYAYSTFISHPLDLKNWLLLNTGGHFIQDDKKYPLGMV